VISLLSLSVLLVPNKNTSPERQIAKDRPERHESMVQVSKKNIGSAAAGALSSGKDSVMDVLVMENVLYAANTTRIYDLKGSERSRWSQEDPTQAGAVLMDDNLRENNLTQPILVSLVMLLQIARSACHAQCLVTLHTSYQAIHAAQSWPVYMASSNASVA